MTSVHPHTVARGVAVSTRGSVAICKCDMFCNFSHVAELIVTLMIIVLLQ